MQLNNTQSMNAFAGMGALSALISGGAQFMGGQQQRGAYGYNAAITRQNTAEKAEVSSDKYTALIGKERSLYAKAGVDISSGSPLSNVVLRIFFAFVSLFFCSLDSIALIS